ncbi:FAD-dependent oxidoreductase [Chitinibacter sp. ZOR0017]|uniref:FAD-dependent oxidoreductase n=1 Tax=Chitinibacter sp. ZOR0017 TaxID=1339254 RepID=UPI000646F0A7|nr:FAD-dependent oxidoreductase [Chitinibacter sp. ZOR0017]
MSENLGLQDAVIIGGGFYGAAIAIYLAKQRGFKRVLIIERESSLLTRASYNNQARVHNGYHYPRSFTTAYRSRVNLPRFVQCWPQAVKIDFTKLYAIARRNSKVTGKQFQRFCHEIGARVEIAKPEQRALFSSQLIEDVFLVDEYAFDAMKLASWAEDEIKQCGIQVRFESCATAIYHGPDNSVLVQVKEKGLAEVTIATRFVFNCTYSGLNQFTGDFPGTTTKLKQEITEMALMQAPAELEGFGITVMDGPFFSMMPFPARALHTLSHVRYTPHLHWIDQLGINPYQKLEQYERQTRVERMVRDVARYVPSVLRARYIDSLFEVKTVLVKNEGDDGRPILFERHAEIPGCFSVLGGKIDNIYDVLERLDDENLCFF